MKTIFSFLIILTSLKTFADGDGPLFLKNLPFTSMTCQGDEYFRDIFYKHAGDVEITIQDKTSDTPYIVIKTAIYGLTFKIGNGFVGQGVKSKNCRYYSTDKSVSYLCDLDDSSKALTFEDVQNAEIKSVFSLTTIQPSADGAVFFKFSNCKVNQ